MTPLLDLRGMSVADKLQLMADLWADLSSENLPSPEWHGVILAERERLVASGEENFVDWEDAQRQLRKELE